MPSPRFRPGVAPANKNDDRTCAITYGCYLKHDRSITKAAAELGISVPTAAGQIKAAKLRGLKPHIKAGGGLPQRAEPAAPKTAAPAKSETRTESEAFRDKETIRLLRAQLRASQREALSADIVRGQIYGLSCDRAQIPDWMIDLRDSASSGPGVPCTIWSDFHWGEVVKPEEVAGMNAFDSGVARERLRSLVRSTIDLCFNHMVNPAYPGIVICLGGDMITGEIHQELAETNDQYTLQALLDLQGELIRALTLMADHFGRVFVPCVVGNHGRSTMKPRAKGRVMTSYEWHLYCQLERHFANDERFTFLIPGETDAHFSIYGHRYMLTHGDSLGVKGGDGIIGSLGPITRGHIKTRNSEAQIGRDFDTILMGHWHGYLPLPGCIVNGALKGYDEYARLYLRAKYQPPIQALWFTHRTRGVTAHWPIYLDEPRDPINERWVEFLPARAGL